MSTQYKDAPELREIATGLIAEHHPKLVGAPIQFIWRDVAATKNSKLVMGKAEVIRGRNAFLFALAANKPVEEFFLIEIPHDAWECLSIPQRFYVVDHYLSWCDISEDGELITVEPDWVEFNAVYRRHGACFRQMSEFESIAIERHEQQMAAQGYTKNGHANGHSNGHSINRQVVLNGASGATVNGATINGGGNQPCQ